MHPQCTLSEDQPEHVSARGHANSMPLDCNFLRRQSRDSLQSQNQRDAGREDSDGEAFAEGDSECLSIIIRASSQISFRPVQRHGWGFCLPESYNPCFSLSKGLASNIGAQSTGSLMHTTYVHAQDDPR